MRTYQFIGVDVSKEQFDVALGEQLSSVFSLNKKGLTAFKKWIKAHTDTPWICMEATGHYSEIIAEFLILEGIKVSISNPMQIKHFCRAKLLRNKNDALDARAIASYAALMPLREYQMRSQEQKELKALSKLLDTLKGQRVQLSHQLASTRGKIAHKNLKQLIKSLDKKITGIEQEMQDLVKSDKNLNEQFELVTSIPGIGKITAYQILGIVTDMSAFDNAKQFAAFIGVSPKQNQSGKNRGITRLSKIGNSRLRKAFYMASLSAKQFNPHMQAFGARLHRNGKAPKAILCAVMRKLAHLVFAVLKNKRPFELNYTTN